MASKVSLPKGMRDFNPQQVLKRQYIIHTIKNVFELYGFMPIETPVMEQMQTLAGKGGEESDKLMFKVLNSGDFLNKVESAALEEKNSKTIANKISEKGLRYDLTVPLARYVVMHQNEIAFPFKRYQIQPVWRADRPQKGRYREFWQCDADVLGSDSLLNEVDLVNIYAKAFELLGIEVEIKFSSRKLLAAMAESLGKPNQLIDFVIALDKLDKIGVEKVNAELANKGFEENAFELINTLQEISNSNADFLETELAQSLFKSEMGKAAIEEIKFVKAHSKLKNLKIDATLARGLDYYTGPIFEVVSPLFKGSLGGGGRYDNLTGNFGLPGVSGVGISFGLDRIYDLMQEQNLFKSISTSTTKILIVNFETETQALVYDLAAQLRANDIATEFYPSAAKLKKQMKYANEKAIPYVLLVGSRELESGNLTLKNMLNGTQDSLKISDIIEKFKSANI